MRPVVGGLPDDTECLGHVKTSAESTPSSEEFSGPITDLVDSSEYHQQFDGLDGLQLPLGDSNKDLIVKENGAVRLISKLVNA